jgi:DNA-binding NarL/FixJ family response regulator
MGAMKNKIGVGLIDDHHLVRRALSRFLRAFDDFMVVGDASNIEEMLQHIEAWLPDIILMDLHTSHAIDDADAIRRFHQFAPNTKIIVLSSVAHDNVLVEGLLRAGAFGYISKEVDPQKLLTSIRMVAFGRSLLN